MAIDLTKKHSVSKNIFSSTEPENYTSKNKWFSYVLLIISFFTVIASLLYYLDDHIYKIINTYNPVFVDSSVKYEPETIVFETRLKDSSLVRIIYEYQNNTYIGSALANEKAKIKHSFRMYFSELTSIEVYENIPKHIEIATNIVEEFHSGYDFFEIKDIKFTDFFIERMNNLKQVLFILKKEKIDSEIIEIRHKNKIRQLELQEIERQKQLAIEKIERQKQLAIERYEILYNSETQKKLDMINKK